MNPSPILTIVFLLLLLLVWLLHEVRATRSLRAQRGQLLKERDIAYSFLHDVGDILSGDTTDMNSMLQRVLFYAQRTTRAEAGALYMVDDDGETLRARAVSGTFPPIVSGLSESIDKAASKLEVVKKMVWEQTEQKGKGILGAVLASGQPMLIKNASIEYRIPQFDFEFLQVHSILAVPMRVRNEALGVLVVTNPVDEEPFNDSDQSLLQALGDQASIALFFLKQSSALEEKRRIDRDLGIAHEIQEALLPSEIPSFRGVKATAFCVPARQIGGDFYDFIPLDESHLGVVIADVSGKGISGAIVMAICRSTIRTLAPSNLDPAEVLKAAARMIATDLSEDLFISVLYMVLNTETRSIRIARAGHPQPVLFSPTSEGGRPLDSKGIAIGLADDRTFNNALEVQRVVLSPGDVLVAYTDGVTEAMDAEGEEWGLGRLSDTLQSTVKDNGGVSSVTQTVREKLLAFVGSTPQYDDMTLIALEIMESEE